MAFHRLLQLQSTTFSMNQSLSRVFDLKKGYLWGIKCQFRKSSQFFQSFAGSCQTALCVPRHFKINWAGLFDASHVKPGDELFFRGKTKRMVVIVQKDGKIVCQHDSKMYKRPATLRSSCFPVCLYYVVVAIKNMIVMCLQHLTLKLSEDKNDLTIMCNQ